MSQQTGSWSGLLKNRYKICYSPGREFCLLALHPYRPVRCVDCPFTSSDPDKIFKHITNHHLPALGGDPEGEEWTTGSVGLLCSKCPFIVDDDSHFRKRHPQVEPIKEAIDLEELIADACKGCKTHKEYSSYPLYVRWKGESSSSPSP